MASSSLLDFKRKGGTLIIFKGIYSINKVNTIIDEIIRKHGKENVLLVPFLENANKFLATKDYKIIIVTKIDPYITLEAGFLPFKNKKIINVTDKNYLSSI